MSLLQRADPLREDMQMLDFMQQALSRMYLLVHVRETCLRVQYMLVQQI